MDRGKFGDEAFSELFEDFQPTLQRIAWKICGRSDVAEEFCQEAFLRYFERRDSLPSGDEARYWLIRVVKNLALTYERRRKRENDMLHRHVFTQRASSVNDAERHVLEEESRQHVRQAILALPYKLRIVLVLREYADYPYAKIAKALRISESNVKVRIFRARRHLADTIKKGDIHVP